MMDTLPYKSKLLIIHQDTTLQSLMMSMLESMGYDIETVSNIAEAAENFEHSPANLVLAEADLTDADAVEAIFAMKRKSSATPFILLVADEQPALARQVVRRGVSSVLRYPTSTLQFRAAVAHELPPPKSAAPPSVRRFTPLNPLPTFGRDDACVGASIKNLDPVAALDAQNRARRRAEAPSRASALSQAAAPLSFEASSRLSVSPKRLRWHDERSTTGVPSIGPLKVALEEPERRIILEALEAFQWNRQETARVLEIDRTTLYKKIKKYKLEETLAR